MMMYDGNPEDDILGKSCLIYHIQKSKQINDT